MLEPEPASEEFQELAAAVRAYNTLMEESRRQPVDVDPVELLGALSDVGTASIEMVRRAGAL